MPADREALARHDELPKWSGTLFPYLRRKARNLRVRIFLATCAVSIFLSAGKVPTIPRAALTERSPGS